MKDRKFQLIITWQAAISCLFLLGWTYTLKTNTPAGTDDPTEADDRMRETKAAFVERLNIDHYFYPSATSTYDATDAGKHRYITFREPNDLTSMAADESALFSKDVSSVTELHWIDESDNVLQLTSGGAINIVSADLLGTLANNTYFTAVDAAGTGTVDLIKADANDVAVVPNDSQTATNAAPTQTKALVNKKYVDDHVGHDGDGYVLYDLNGTPELIYTKYLTGTLDADAETDIAHGVANGLAKILSITVFANEDGANTYRQAYNAWFDIYYDGTNITLTNVEATIQGNAYRIKVDYFL